MIKLKDLGYKKAMKIQANFKPIKFTSQEDFFRKKDSEELKFPNEEPMGFLLTNLGQKAFIEFIFDNGELSQQEILGSDYQGSGIYLIDYENKVDNDDLPFWVVLEQGRSLTVGDTKKILIQIEQLLLDSEHETKNHWKFSA